MAGTVPPRAPRKRRRSSPSFRGTSRDIATLKLAATVLHRGIERYREKNQGPILTRASDLFAALTGGSFARLQIDDDGDGRSVLEGRAARRPAGRRRGDERRLARSALPRPAAGQPRVVAVGPRADPVRGRRHPAELRRPPRHGRAGGPGRICRRGPRSCSSPTTATSSTWRKPSLPRDVVFVHELPVPAVRVTIPTPDDFPTDGPAGRSSLEMAQ